MQCTKLNKKNPTIILKETKMYQVEAVFFSSEVDVAAMLCFIIIPASCKKKLLPIDLIEENNF